MVLPLLGLIRPVIRLVALGAIAFGAAQILGVDLSAVVGGWIVDQINPFAVQ